MTANVYIGKVLVTRANTAETNLYTGLLGEITFDTGLNTIRVFDGNTTGGYIIPTMSNVDAAVTTANTDMKSYVDTQIVNNWVNNAAAQAASIDSLTANAAAQAASITVLNGRVVSLQAEVNGIVVGSGFATNAQITAANLEISSLRSNVAAANTAIIGSNATMKIYVDAAVSSLTSNAATQANAIAALNANVSAANLEIGNLQSAILSQPYVMGNLNNWTSNVTTIGSALDQLAARINALDNLGQP